MNMAPYSKTHLLFRSRSFIATAVLSLSLATHLPAALVYNELFPNTLPSGDADLDHVGWVGYSGATATTLTGIGNGKVYVPSGNGNGNPSTKGFLAFNAVANGNYVAYESGLSINPADGALNISWQHHASLAGNAETRLLLQVGGQWVATNGTFSPLGTGLLSVFGDTANAGLFTNSFVFTSSASSWRDVTFISGSTLSISGTARTADLANAPITAIGFYYVASGSVSTRIDTLQVDQVPEPHLSALLLAGGLGLVARRKR